ncbi:polymorphic toxin-type HINT domain-containing protein [Streptomyces sp. NPDC058231]|uniref:polymorphic toxin-type HINT domain-containing protein n=1 Tax=Streptomyces sp. NPDC058231 TaxID=3346392 RepID=UPI0036EAC3C5
MTPEQVDVQVLDREAVAPVGGVGLGVQVSRTDGGSEPGQVQLGIDYSGFQYAYGGDFAQRLMLVKLPACALTTPEAEGCTAREVVPSDNDVKTGTLTATVTADADTTVADPGTDGGDAGLSTQLGTSGGATVYAVTTGSSFDQGDYRASSLAASGAWSVSTGSGAFTYNLPIQLPAPAMGSAPSLGLSYNSQSVDGRTSATNNQASWAGMGWDLGVGFIERRYRNCSDDGLPTIGDMCWDSPNTDKEPDGAVYVISLNGVTSELVQDGTGTGSYHLRDDPGWRVQHLTGGHGADDEYWVIGTQDGQRYYFGWGRSERTQEATSSVYTMPVVGNNAGEPCHDQFPEPCTQAWRWNLDRVMDANEVDTTYFYDKEYNHYRSVANTDKPRQYTSGGYLSAVEYGWPTQIADSKPTGRVELTHVGRCVERMAEADPLRDEPSACPSISSTPTSYPDVPVDLMCDGTANDYNCAGKTYFPTFFTKDMLWDIKTFALKTTGDGWDLVQQYQTKHGLPNPAGTIGKTLWLDYMQRKTYGDGTDIVLPVINFNGVDLDNKVGSSEINFRRISTIHDELGATTTVTYGAPDACDAASLPTQASNKQDCFWQKWTPEGETDAKSGWFKKFLVTQVEVDPTVTSNQDGAPVITTSYDYAGGAGWAFTNDPLTKDEDESWTDWRGYQQVAVTTGTGTAKHTTYNWLYRGLDGDRIDKTDPSKTRAVSVSDGEGTTYTDEPWLSGQTIETSQRDDTGNSHERVFHSYWTHTTATYDGIADARFVREAQTTTQTKISTGWREHVVQSEFDDTNSTSTTYGLPLRTDDWGETNVADNRCTTYGRAYNTDDYDSTGAQRWTALQDEVRHYNTGCADRAAANQDTYTATLFDNATSIDTDKPVDGNATEVRTYTDASTYRSIWAGYDDAGRAIWGDDSKHNRTTTTYSPANLWPTNGITSTTADPDGTMSAKGPLSTTVWMSRFWGVPYKTQDANKNVTTVTLDAAGRTTEVWKPTETGTSPSLKFGYSIPTATSSGIPDSVTDFPQVSTQTLQSGSTYLSSYAYLDGLGRTRETQNPLPDIVIPVQASYRQVAVTRYDSAGNTVGTSAVFRSRGAAASDGLVSPKLEDLPSYTEHLVDWAARTVQSRLRVGDGTTSQIQAANRVTTTYNGDYTTVSQPDRGDTDTYADVYGQVSKVVEHDGTSLFATQYQYGGNGELTQITDARGNNTAYTYDWAKQRLTVNDPDAGESITKYDENGQIDTVTSNAKKTVVTYSYDNIGRKTSVSSGSNELAAWTWDDPTVPNGLGKVTTTTSRDTDGNAYTSKINSFDTRGRPLSTTTTIPANVNGLAGSYTTTQTYDAADHIITATYPKAGGLDAETVTTSYDSYGHPDRLTGTLGNAVYVNSTRYDDYSRLVGRDYGGTFTGTGVNAKRSYAYQDTNGTGRLDSISTTVNVNGLIQESQKDTYSYDPDGKLTELREQASGQTAQSQCFRYDDLARLTDAYTRAAASDCSNWATPAVGAVSDFTGEAPYQTRYTYDRLGNLQSVTDTDAAAKQTTRDYLYPGYDDSGTWTTANPDQPPHGVRQIDNKSGTTITSKDTFTYTPDGQLEHRVEPGATTADNKKTDYTWTALGQLNTVTTTKTTGTELTRYTYDADGNLLVRTNPQETVAYLGGTELRTTDGHTATATRYYACGTAAVAMRTTDSGSGKVTYLMADTQASTQLAVDAKTGTATRRRYTPFGDERSGNLPTGTDHGFLGKTEDTATGLSLLGARAYDPKLGRFLSPDPLSTPYDPQNLSAFSYTHNDPINFKDPTGLCADDGTGHCHPKPIEKPQPQQPPSPSSGSPTIGGSGSKPAGDGDGGFSWGKLAGEVAGIAAGVVVGVVCESALVAGSLETGGATLLATPACGAAAGFAQAAVSDLVDGDDESTTEALSNEAEGAAAGAIFGLAFEADELMAEKNAVRKIGICKNSFLPTQQVKTVDGTTKPLKDVQTGDKVIATDPETGKTEPREVLATIITKDDKDFTELTVTTNAGDVELIATDHHPFWSPSEHAWVDTADLHSGMTLRTDVGTPVIVRTTRSFQKTMETRNLTVDGLHTYYVLAGTTPVLVHNSNCGGRWKLGEDYSTPSKNGVAPSLSTMRKRFWKNEAAEPGAADQYGAANIGRMKRGSAPQRQRPDGSRESMELSHEPIPDRDGGMLLTPRWPEDHAIMDPGGYRRLPPGY